MSTDVDGTLRPSLTLSDGIVLFAPGAAFVPCKKTLILADPHVGYLPTLHAHGYGVPDAPDDELLARVASLLARTKAECVVIAGDLVHGRAAGRRARGASALERFVRVVGRRRLQVVLGNHDRHIVATLAELGIPTADSLAVGPHTVLHGDDVMRLAEARRAARRSGGRVILGHLHPAFALEAARWVPAFVTARGMLFLPALSPWSRGLDVRSDTLQAQLDERLPKRTRRGLALAIGDRVLAVGTAWERRAG